VDLLLSIADRAIALAGGKVIADGPVAAVREAPDPWLREYFAAARA
jgi:ABC-type transporter Mla maintaining outer membrane lipid asymmetry ATPase subunit MlaF